MNEKEFVESMTYLGLAYNKTYTQEEIKQHYDFLKEYSDTTFTTAVKNLIRTSKYLPKINEIIEKCEEMKEKNKFEIINIMNKQGYFKDVREYEKAMNFIKRGVIPKWFLEDMRKYQQKAIIYEKKQLIIN